MHPVASALNRLRFVAVSLAGWLLAAGIAHGRQPPAQPRVRERGRDDDRVVGTVGRSRARILGRAHQHVGPRVLRLDDRRRGVPRRQCAGPFELHVLRVRVQRLDLRDVRRGDEAGVLWRGRPDGRRVLPGRDRQPRVAALLDHRHLPSATYSVRPVLLFSGPAVPAGRSSGTMRELTVPQRRRPTRITSRRRARIPIRTQVGPPQRPASRPRSMRRRTANWS